MPPSQTSRQHRFPKVQLHCGFSPRLEVLGSLIFWIGLTLTKPAWSAPKVDSAALSASNSNQKQSVVVTEEGATEPGVGSREKNANSPSPPEVLPQGAIAQATPLWSQPLNGKAEEAGKGASIQDAGRKLSPSKESRQGTTEESSPASPLPLSPENSSSTHAVKEGKSPPPPVELVSTLSPLLPTPFSLSEQPAQPTSKEDPELGVLRLRELPTPASLPLSPENGSSTQSVKDGKSPSQPGELVSTPEPQPFPSERGSESQQPAQPASGEDPELGILRLRELPTPPPPSKPAVYLLGGVGYFRSSNIFSRVESVDLDDGLFRTGVTLLAVPSLGPDTSLFASVGGNIIRYSDFSEYDFDELRFNAGIRQQIGRRTYGELGWSNRQLFSKEGGDRFLNDHSVYLELGRRDPLGRQLALDTYYQARLSFANPSDRSQLINSLGASLAYYPSSSLEVALDYQFALADFTQQERQDQYHQLIARLTYTMSRNSRVYVFGGHSFGSSSDEFTDFDGLVFGVGLDLNLVLF